MNIAIVTPWEEATPPKTYGGTELVAHNLTESLVVMGHNVTLFAPGDSKTQANLVPTLQQSLRSKKAPQIKRYHDQYEYMATAKTIELITRHSFDVILNHIGWRLLPFAFALKDPMITVMHGPTGLPQERMILETYAHLPFISISNNQRLGMPKLNYIGTAYNGIDTDKFTLGNGKGEYLAFLGRISPEKGIEQAIAIAKSTHYQLRIAAKVDRVDEAYFTSKVLPLIDGKQIIFVGEVDHAQKNTFLGAAKALLMPIQWDEPFGLVNVESMACGTPVIGLKRGALPELIISGKTGFLCSSVKEMTIKVGQLHAISRTACRSHVIQHFSTQSMTEQYITIIDAFLQGNRSPRAL